LILHRKNVSERVRSVFASIILLTCAFTAAADSPAGKLTLTFGAGEVAIAGIDGPHQVVVFGIGIGRHGYRPLLTREVKPLTDDDGDGKATLTVHQTPTRSVWVVVDVETGEYVVTTPAGSFPTALALAAGEWRGNQAHVDVRRRYLEALVVRPGVGAWALRLTEGGSNDGDGLNNGLTRLRLDRMDKVIGEEKGPSFVIPKDLVVIVDPLTLDTFISEAR
jgi:hypothetical protein